MVWLPFFIFPLILGLCHHPNWRTPSFFRGVGILAHQPDGDTRDKHIRIFPPPWVSPEMFSSGNGGGHPLGCCGKKSAVSRLTRGAFQRSPELLGYSFMGNRNFGWLDTLIFCLPVLFAGWHHRGSSEKHPFLWMVTSPLSRLGYPPLLLFFRWAYPY